MANIESAKKRNRQNQKRRLRNRVFRGRARSYVKQARLAIESGNVDEARAATMSAVSALDKAAEKGVIHKNNASRRKSRIMRSLAALEEGK
ncbi:MAG: 30S ribosomal protein S20 [Anaerolineae bacterium]|nr:30S ribosomal protein S20 [Anaerolineae bacterium]